MLSAFSIATRYIIKILVNYMTAVCSQGLIKLQALFSTIKVNIYSTFLVSNYLYFIYHMYVYTHTFS